MAAHLLLIEDDPALLSVLEATIAFGGFTSRAAATGLDGIRLLRCECFDAVLMDLSLPDFDGRTLLATLRQLTANPIIVVSGSGTEGEKVEALDLGADDAVSKPFLPNELLARIRAALRRAAPHSLHAAPPLGCGLQKPSAQQPAAALPPDRARLDQELQNLSMTDGERKVLRTLMENLGHPVSKKVLLQALYGDRPQQSTKVVEVHLSRIRHKLRQLPPRYSIKNIRGLGWRVDPT